MSDWEDRIVDINGAELLTIAQYMAIASEVTGKKTEYQYINDDEMYEFFDSIGVPRTTEEMWADTAKNFPFCSDGMVSFGRAIRLNQMSTFTDDFEKWTKMNDDGIVPIGITEVDYPTAANYFAMGYTSMFMTGSNALGVAYANNPDLKGNLGSFKLPGDYPGTMLGTEGYAISEYTTDEEAAAAVEFLRFFVEHDDQMMFWQSSGKIPATVDGQKAEYITGDDYAGYLQQIEDGCRPTVSFAGISGLKSALGDAYAAVFSNEKTNEEAIADLEKTVDELMEDYN